MYSVEYTGRFRKDYKLALSRGYKEALIKKVIALLINRSSLPPKYKAHKLSGEYKNCWECHIEPDWLLIWQVDENDEILTLIRTGTHSDLF